MSKAGSRIIAGIKDAIDGNIARVTMEGRTYVRIEQDAELLSLGEGLARGAHLTPDERNKVYQFIRKMTQA